MASLSLNNLQEENFLQNESMIYKNTFESKLDYLASRSYFIDRSKNASVPLLIETNNKNNKENNNKPQLTRSNTHVWDKKPIDLTWKNYHPKPPKRNSRQAIKPWMYNRYLRPIEPKEPEFNERSEENLANQFLAESMNKTFHVNQESLTSKDFEVLFRPTTPLSSKVDASKHMSFRDGLSQYGMSKKFPDKLLEGMPEFVIKSEKDPSSLKLKTKNKDTIYGPPSFAVLRDMQPGSQIGDISYREDRPRYDPKLILPTLKFPNAYNCYTRHKSKQRTAQTAFWERVLPILNSRWKEENSNQFKN